MGKTRKGKTATSKKRKLHSLKANEAKRRRLEATTTSTSTAQVSGSSGEGGPTAGESALTGPSPTVVDSPLVTPPELDLPGPSGTTTEEVPPSTSEEVTVSATQRKLGSLGVKGNPSGEEMQGRRVLDLPTLASAIQRGAVCVTCHSKLKVIESFKNRRGMVSRITFECTNKYCNNEEFLSDPRSQNATALNTTVCLAARSAGLGRRGLQIAMASLDLLPPITGRAYSEHNTQIAKAVRPVIKNMMQESAHRLHDFYGNPRDEVICVGVSIDGTWMKRGRLSKYGVVAAISCETGEILDYEIMCKLCDKCKAYKINHTQQEFDEWWVMHKDSDECEINHTKDSGLMECLAAVAIFKHSEEKLKLRYTSMLGDGDTKTLAKVNAAIPYGPGVVVIKEECVGHVAKRFYKRLTDMRKAKVPNEKGVMATKMGKNGMTNDTQVKLCRYYKGAILSNTNDVDGMINDIQAIFHHCSSTDQNPQHSFSWCKFNKYMHEKTKNPDTDMPEPEHREKPLIPTFYSEHFRECFDKVCRRELLDKCKRGATQNNNESFHNVIWGMARKSQFCSLTTLRLAVDLAVSKYNLGYVSGFSRCFVAALGQGALSSRVVASFSLLDRDRMEHSARRTSEVHKKRRQYLAMLRSRKEQAAIDAGGVSYGPALDEELDDEEEED